MLREIPLVLIHRPHSEGPKPPLTRGATTKLPWIFREAKGFGAKFLGFAWK
jgi:hypothetical protein